MHLVGFYYKKNLWRRVGGAAIASLSRVVKVQGATVERGDLHVAVLMIGVGCKKHRNYGRLGVRNIEITDGWV